MSLDDSVFGDTIVLKSPGIVSTDSFAGRRWFLSVVETMGLCGTIELDKEYSIVIDDKSYGSVIWGGIRIDLNKIFNSVKYKDIGKKRFKQVGTKYPVWN